MTNRPEICRNKCNGCGLCLQVCPCHRLVLKKNIAAVLEIKDCKLCDRWCGVCELVCPVEAVQYLFEIDTEE